MISNSRSGGNRSIRRGSRRRRRRHRRRRRRCRRRGRRHSVLGLRVRLVVFVDLDGRFFGQRCFGCEQI